MRRERVGQAAEAADAVPATAAPPLWLGREGDRFEREADRLAGEMAGGGDGPGDGGGGRRRIAHARGAPGGAAVDDAVARQVRAARGRGRPLPARVRVPMERALGAGLGAVRLHTDEAADGLNRRLDAEAFTTGSDIFLRRGGSDLHGPAGHEVLAHELVHVVQQAGGNGADPGSGPGLVQRARGRGGRGGGRGRGRGGGRPPARADKKRARDEPETTDERDAPAAPPPWQQYVHHFQLPVPPLVAPGQAQGSTSAPPAKQMKTGSGAAGPPPTTTPTTVPHGSFPDRQPYRHYVTRPVQHPTAQSPAAAQHQRPPYPGPAFVSYPGSPPGSVHPPYPGSPPGSVHPSHPWSMPGSVHPSLLGSVPGPAFVSYPGGYPLHQGGVPGPAFVSYPGPRDVVMSGGPTSLKRPLDQDGGPPAKKAKTIHVRSLDRDGMIEHLSTDLVTGQAPKRITVGVVVWNINHLSKDDRQADATDAPGRRRVATKKSRLGYSSEGLTAAMGNLQKTLAAATPALVAVVDQLLEGYDEEKAAKAKGEKGNKARTDVSQHRSDLVELRALDLPAVLTPGLQAMLAWRNDDGTSTVEQRAGWLADIRALHRVWRRIKRIESMLVKGNPKLAEKKAAQQQLRAAAGVNAIALGAELKTLLDGLPLADLQAAIGNLKRSTVVDLATDNFFRHKAINLVLINEMNLGIDALRQRAAGSQGRFGVSSGPVMLAKAKVDDDAPAGGKAAKTGFPVTTSDGGKGFATGKQYEYYPAAHKTEGPDALGSRGTFYVRTDGRFVVQGESDNTVLPWDKAEETFRGIVVHRLVQNGQELWAGILHTTPAGHDLDRRDIWPQIRVALDELNRVARHYQVPLLVGGDFYIPAEGIIDDPTDAQSKAIREQDPLLVDRVKLTNIARNIFLRAWEQGTVADLITNVPAVPVVAEPGGPEPAAPGPTGDAGPVPAPPEGLPAEESKVWERYWQRIVPHLPTLLSGFHAETAAGTLAPGLMDPPLNWHQTRAGGDIKKIDIIRNARKVPGLDKADQPRLTMQRALKPLGYRVVASGTATNPKERGKRENKMQLADLFLVNEHWQTALSGIVSPDGGQLKRVDDKALTATRTYWKISDHSPAAMVAATHADDDRPYQAFTLEEDAAGVARKANLRNWDEFAKRVAGLPLTSEPPSLAERLLAIRAIVDRPLLRPDPAMEATVRLHVAALAAVAGIPTKPDQGAALAEMAKWRPFYAVDIAEDEPHLLAAPTTTTGPTPGDGAPPQAVGPGGSTPPAVLPTVPPPPGVVGSSPSASTPASTPAPARMSLSWLLTSDTATGGTPTVPGFPFHDPGLTPPAHPYLTAPKYGPPPTQPAKHTPTSSTITPPTVSPPGASGGQGFAFTPIPGLTPTTPTGPAPGSGAATGTFRFDLAKPPVLGGTGTTFVPPQLPLPVPVAAVPTGEVEHVAASCYISALLHVFASHPAYQEILDPQQAVSLQAVGFRTASGLRHLVAKLRNPALRVTQAEVTALIQFLDPLDDLLMGEGGRARQLLYFQHQWTGQILTQKASAYAVQQDAAEILAKLLDRLQPGARTTATVRSSLTGSPVVPDSVKDEPYRIIDLPIVGGVTSVQGALERFSQPEQAADDWTGRTKQLRFSVLPEVLTIALKRFHRNAYGLTQKVTTPVLANDPLVIPEVCLVPELKAGNAPPPTYDLVQVTHHEGTLTGGHYTSYGRLTTGEWYKHDDTDPAKRTMPGEWATSGALITGYIYVYVKR